MFTEQYIFPLIIQEFSVNSFDDIIIRALEALEAGMFKFQWVDDELQA